MKIDTNNSYKLMRLTHILAIFWGFPITRRKINDNNKHDKDSIVQGNTFYIYIWTRVLRATGVSEGRVQTPPNSF